MSIPYVQNRTVSDRSGRPQSPQYTNPNTYKKAFERKQKRIENGHKGRIAFLSGPLLASIIYVSQHARIVVHEQHNVHISLPNESMTQHYLYLYDLLFCFLVFTGPKIITSHGLHETG